MDGEILVALTEMHFDYDVLIDDLDAYIALNGRKNSATHVHTGTAVEWFEDCIVSSAVIALSLILFANAMKKMKRPRVR